MHNQGKAIVERVSGGYMLMTPDGEVTFHRNQKSVISCVRVWSARKAVGDSMVIIEWRGVRKIMQ